MRILKWILLVIASVLLLGCMLVCGFLFILPEFQPTPWEQLLRLADVPPEHNPPPADRTHWWSHDYTIVEQALLNQVPHGASQATVQTFLAQHQVTYTTEDATMYSGFESQQFPCRIRIGIQWCFDDAGQLVAVHIFDDAACL